MKISLPNNIFSLLIYSSLKNAEVLIRPSSLILKDVLNGEAEVGLIPSLDLITEHEIFLSNKIGIAFDASLSNSYFYFKPNERSIDSIYLRGDLSKNDIILSKILLSEKYNSNPEFILDSSELDFNKANYLIAGNENFNYLLDKSAVSFADQISEFIEFPYVNFLFASKNSDNLKAIENALNGIDDKLENEFGKLFQSLDINFSLQNYILQNVNSVYYNLTDNEITGLLELLKLPYYYGIIDNIIEPNFVK